MSDAIQAALQSLIADGGTLQAAITVHQNDLTAQEVDILKNISAADIQILRNLEISARKSKGMTDLSTVKPDHVWIGGIW